MTGRIYSRKLGWNWRKSHFPEANVCLSYTLNSSLNVYRWSRCIFLNRRASLLMHTSVRHVIQPCCYNAFQSSRKPFHFLSAVFLLIERPYPMHPENSSENDCLNDSGQIYILSFSETDANLGRFSSRHLFFIFFTHISLAEWHILPEQRWLGG